jgi:hypothetical protein
VAAVPRSGAKPQWLTAAPKHFSGPVLVGRDLLEI